MKDVPKLCFLGKGDGIVLQVDAFEMNVVPKEIDECVDPNIRDIIAREIKSLERCILLESLCKGDERSVIEMITSENQLVADMIRCHGLRE